MKSRHKGRHFFRYMSISEAKLPTQSTPFRIFYQYFNKFSYFSTEIQTAFLNRGTVPCQKKLAIKDGIFEQGGSPLSKNLAIGDGLLGGHCGASRRVWCA